MIFESYVTRERECVRDPCHVILLFYYICLLLIHLVIDHNIQNVTSVKNAAFLLIQLSLYCLIELPAFCCVDVIPE